MSRTRGKCTFRSSWLMTPILLVVWPGFVSCGIQQEYSYQSGKLVCDSSSQCPDVMFCENYFNAYVYAVDVMVRPAAENRWGFCSHEGELIKTEPPNGVFVENCFNGRDEDGDGLIDCDDPECQTAPVCRARIQQECFTGNPSAFCADRLGFPIPRDGGDATGANCPGAVGVIHSGEGGGRLFCLPRCRLYFPYQEHNPANSEEEDFAGSDAYCGAVTSLNRTTDGFSGGLRCQHTGLVQNAYRQEIQQDVCLPENPDRLLESSLDSTPQETCADVCGGSECLRISYRRRTWTEWRSTYGETGMITTQTEGNDPDRYLLTAFYCLD